MTNLIKFTHISDGAASAYKFPPEFLNELNGQKYQCISVSEKNAVIDHRFGPDVVLHHQTREAQFISPQVTEMCGVREVRINRMLKSLYNHLFNVTGKSLSLYKPITVWSDPHHYIAARGTQGETVLLRPHMGARGMGFILNKGSERSVQSVREAFLTHNGRRGDGSILEHLESKGIQVSVEGSRSREDIAEIVNSSFNYEVVEYIPNVKEEYRIVTDFKGDPVLFVKRERSMSNSGIMQARGNNKQPNECLTYEQMSQEIVSIILGQIGSFFGALQLPVHSFDLFITDDGKWGLFEGCSEFGHTSLPDGFVTDQFQKLIIHAATKSLR